MLKNKLWMGIILSILLLVFSIPGFTAYYKYTQESGDNFYVGIGDKADALEDTNEMRQIIDDLGALLVHSKRDDLYPKNGTTGGTIQIPEAGLKFSNAPVNDDIAAYIAGEMMWQTKVELGLDLTLYYLKTAIDTQGEVENIWGVSLANDSELHTILTLGTPSGLSLDEQELSLAVADTDTTGALNDTDWDTFNNKLSNITEESIGSLSNVDLTDLADGKILKYNFTTSKFECEDEAGGGSTTFTGLTDTPANYTDQAGKYVKVNAEETALEFDTPGGGGTVTTSGTPVQYDYARFTDATTIEGRSYSEMKTDLAYQLSDMSDVGSTTPTDKYVLVADGDSWESRALVEADISNLGTAAALVADKLDVFAATTEAELYTVLSDVTLFLEDTVDDTSPELGGEMDAGAHSIGFTQQTITYNVTTTTVNWTLGNKATVTLTGNVGTLAFTNPTNPCNVLLKIVQDGTGSRLITAYDADVLWAGGTKPTLTTTANGIDICSFYWDGTNYFGVASLAFATP